MANNLKRALSLSLFSLAFLAVVFPFKPANAAGIGLTIQPVKVSQTLKPGQTVSGKIILSNASDDAVEVSVKVEDFVPMAGGETIQFVGRAPGLTTVRDWITIGGSKSFTFQKGETREIPYTITAPDGAEPGSHFGVAFFKASKINSGGDTLQIGTQVGMLVLVTVPGNFLQKGKILDFIVDRFTQKGPVSFKLKFENTGTVHFEPKGTIKITNMLGRQVASIPIEGTVVLPTGVKDVNAVWHVKGFLAGKYNAFAEIIDGEGNVLTSKVVSFYAFPLWYTLSFLAALLIIFFVIKFLKGRIKISVNLK